MIRDISNVLLNLDDDLQQDKMHDGLRVKRKEQIVINYKKCHERTQHKLQEKHKKKVLNEKLFISFFVSFTQVQVEQKLFN